MRYLVRRGALSSLELDHRCKDQKEDNNLASVVGFGAHPRVRNPTYIYKYVRTLIHTETKWEMASGRVFCIEKNTLAGLRRVASRSVRFIP